MPANAYRGGMAAPQIQRMYDLADAFTARGLQPNVTVGGWGGLAQGIGGLAQALAGKTIADKADRKRGEYADRLKGQIGGLGLDPKYGPLVDILAENGDYGTIVNLATQQPDSDLVQVVQDGKKVWVPKSQAAGLQSDYPEAGKTRERYSGSVAIQEEFDPVSGQWVEIGRGGRWAPTQPAAQTPKSLTERVWETLISGDPTTPEYALAYQEATKPQAQTGVNEQGQQIVTYITPELPPNIRRPSYMQQAAAPGAGQSAAAPQAAPGASGPRPGDFSAPAPQSNGQFTASAPIVTGVSSKRDQPLTEDQRKNMQLYDRSNQQLGIVEKNFDAMTQIGNQAGGMLPQAISAYATSEQYQRASNALTDIAASYLYSVSGATANPGEVANLAKTLIPIPGESAGSIADKKARVRQMVDSIKTRAGTGTGGAAADTTDNDPLGIR